MATAYNEITNDEAREIAGGTQAGRDTLRTMGNELLGCGAKMTFGAGTATVASLGVAVKVVSTTAAAGSSNGFTVGTDQKITASFKGTRLVKVQGVFDVDVASGTDNVTLHIYKNGVSVYETAAQSVTAATLQLFGINIFIEMSENDYIELYAENEDTTANVTVAAAAEEIDEVPEHGYLMVMA